MSVSSYVHQELTRLREENQALREEMTLLRDDLGLKVAALERALLADRFLFKYKDER